MKSFLAHTLAALTLTGAAISAPFAVDAQTVRIDGMAGGKAFTINADSATLTPVAPVVVAPPVVVPPVVVPPVVAPPVVTPPAESAQKIAAAFLPADAKTVIPNPERGWYGWPGNQYLNGANAGSLKGLRDKGVTQSLALLNLAAYRTKPLDQSILGLTARQLALYRENGVKAIFRVVYNYDGKGQDASLPQVRQHITQLAPVIDANADAIAHIQGGFIGKWGEQHSSSNGLDSDADKKIIMEAIAQAWPDQFQIAMRYPIDLQKLGWPARYSAMDDCMLSNNTNGGTFNRGLSDPLRQELGKQTETRAFGGETCTLGDANEQKQRRLKCTDALAEFRLSHLVYLNQEYDQTFIDAWKKGGCFDTISASMGYRLQLDKVEADGSAARGGSVVVDVDMRNTGWARLFSQRSLIVHLRHKATGANLPAAGDVLLSVLPSQATSATRVRAVVPVPANAPVGAYDVILSAPDVYEKTATDPRFAIQFANKVTSGQKWNAGEGSVTTGLEVQVR